MSFRPGLPLTSMFAALAEQRPWGRQRPSRERSRCGLPARLHALLAAATLASAACTDPILPDLSTGRVATIEWEGTTPTLYLQNFDGSARVRVHFDSVTDAIPGNRPDLPVTDTTLLAINRVKWSPDGQYLAVVVAPR